MGTKLILNCTLRNYLKGNVVCATLNHFHIHSYSSCGGLWQLKLAEAVGSSQHAIWDAVQHARVECSLGNLVYRLYCDSCKPCLTPVSLWIYCFMLSHCHMLWGYGVRVFV